MAYTTINKSTAHFNTKLVTGNSSSNNDDPSNQQTITGLSFQPDWLWGKNRVQGDPYYHVLVDAVRGSAKRLYSNNDSAESTDDGDVENFTSDGFKLGSGLNLNKNGDSNVFWLWKANGQGSSNTDGSINTTYTSANTTAGFSISTYTGTGSNATVGHGLGSVPKMIIVKRTNATDVWRVYHSSIGATKHLVLNTTAVEATGSNVWNDTAPTSSVFSISTDSAVNASGATYVAYCFTEKTGYSKFGSYVGNSNADGTFVYTGMKPSFVLLKKTNGTEAWLLMDNKRQGYNPENEYLVPNSNTVEGTANHIDLLSNGFKLTTNGGGFNVGNFIYMAFGQSIVGNNNVPATAR
jgi:hypothetical protein